MMLVQLSESRQSKDAAEDPLFGWLIKKSEPPLNPIVAPPPQSMSPHW